MRNYLLIVCTMCLLFVGCKKKESKYIIPHDTFGEILYDFHLADGLYMINYGKFTSHTDSMNFYTDILKEYGYTFAQFDSTMKFYTENPVKFDKLYSEIITNFNKLEYENAQLNMISDSVQNLYKAKQYWVLPKDGLTKRIPFDVAVEDSSEYKIFVFAKRNEGDESENLRITAFYYYKDSASNKEHVDYFPETTYEKGKRFSLYTTSKFLSNKKVKRLRGWILDADNSSGTVRKDVEVKTIVIRKNNKDKYL